MPCCQAFQVSCKEPHHPFFIAQTRDALCCHVGTPAVVRQQTARHTPEAFPVTPKLQMTMPCLRLVHLPQHLTKCVKQVWWKLSAGQNSRLYKHSLRTGTTTQVSDVGTAAAILSLAVDGAGRVWMGHENGLVQAWCSSFHSPICQLSKVSTADVRYNVCPSCCGTMYWVAAMLWLS